MVLARRMATLDLEESGPNSSTIFISCADQGKIEAIVSILGLPSMIMATLMSETQFEPPARRQRTYLSIQQRASELLKKGCFSLCQPAPREWSEMETSYTQSWTIFNLLATFWMERPQPWCQTVTVGNGCLQACRSHKR